MSKARRLFVTTSFLLLVASFAGCLSYDIRSTAKRDAYFLEQEENMAKGLPTFAGPYCYPDQHPGVLSKIVFLAGLSFTLLLVLKNPAFSLPAAAATFAMFAYWYVETQRTWALSSMSYGPSGIDAYLLDAGTFDVISGLLSASLLVGLAIWSVIALVRFLTRTSLP